MALTLPDIEVVSEIVHEQWMEQKKSLGYTSYFSADGEELMVPYMNLSEDAKEIDRGTVRAVYKALITVMK